MDEIKLYEDRQGLFQGTKEGPRIREIQKGVPTEFTAKAEDVPEVLPGTKVVVTFQLTIALCQTVIIEDEESPDDLEKRAWRMILGLGEEVRINPSDCGLDKVEFDLIDED